MVNPVSHQNFRSFYSLGGNDPIDDLYIPDVDINGLPLLATEENPSDSSEDRQPVDSAGSVPAYTLDFPPLSSSTPLIVPAPPSSSKRSSRRVSTDETPPAPATEVESAIDALATSPQAEREEELILPTKDLRQILYKTCILKKEFRQAVQEVFPKTRKNLIRYSDIQTIYRDHREWHRHTHINLALIPEDLLPPEKNWRKADLITIAERVNNLTQSDRVKGQVKRGEKQKASLALAKQLGKSYTEIENVISYLRFQSF